jgi:hypothetical protein
MSVKSVTSRGYRLETGDSELSPAVLRQLKRDIPEEKPMLLPSLKGRANDPLANPVGGNLGVPGEFAVSQKAPRATAGKRKTNELDSSDSSGFMEPANRSPGKCLEPDPGLCLHRQSETQPQARWLTVLTPRANKSRLTAGNSAALTLERRTLC